MRKLSLTPRLIIAEFEKRGLTCRPLGSDSPKTFLEFIDRNGSRRYLYGTNTDKGGAVACHIADDKLATAAIAKDLGIRVPDTEVYTSLQKAADFLQQYGRIVVKPLDGAHGNGVSTNIDSGDKLEQAITRARQFSDTILLQQQASGKDIRILYIGGEFCAASERRPASVVGDGRHTIRELIQVINSSPERGENYQTKYNVIPLSTCQIFLGDKSDSTPQNGEEVQVIGTANIGSGGAAIDLTDEISSELVESGKRMVLRLGMMGTCGVDFLAGPDGRYLIEINASPSFGLHHYPHRGKPRDVAARFVDYLL